MNQVADDLTYSSATVSSLDPTTKQVFTATAKVSGSAPTANALTAIERLENNQQAALKAQSRLDEANMSVYQCTVELAGTVSFRAGQTVALPPNDWGVFGGTWTVMQATHRMRVRSNGYRTELRLRQAPQGSAIVP